MRRWRTQFIRLLFDFSTNVARPYRPKAHVSITTRHQYALRRPQQPSQPILERSHKSSSRKPCA